VDWISWLQGIALVALNNLVLLFWKPWAGAYAGEKGKNLARKEDLNEILAEVRAVTARTSIRAETAAVESVEARPTRAQMKERVPAPRP
jgi:hypothetical protein